MLDDFLKTRAQQGIFILACASSLTLIHSVWGSSSHVGIIITHLYSTQPKMAMRNTPRSRQGCMCSFHWLRESEANYDDWQRIIVTLMKSNWCSTLRALKCYSKKSDKKDFNKSKQAYARTAENRNRKPNILHARPTQVNHFWKNLFHCRRAAAGMQGERCFLRRDN